MTYSQSVISTSRYKTFEVVTAHLQEAAQTDSYFCTVCIVHWFFSLWFSSPPLSFFQERTDNQTPRQWETKNIEFSVNNGAVKVHKCANEWLGFRLVHFCRYYAHYNLLMMRACFPFCIMFLYANAFKSTVWWSTLIKLIPSLCLLVLGWRKWGHGVVAREWWWDLIFRWGLWHFSGFTKNKANRKKKKNKTEITTSRSVEYRLV